MKAKENCTNIFDGPAKHFRDGGFQGRTATASTDFFYAQVDEMNLRR